MHSPKVSVLLPVYNAQKFLSLAVNSMLEQSFTDFELLAHDDGSTDDSLSILKEIETRDHRLRVSSSTNRGLVETLNFMLSQANGELIARMDNDDIALPHRLESQVRFLDDMPDVCAVGTQIMAIDHKGRRIKTFSLPLEHNEIDACHLEFGTAIAHPAVMIRKSALNAVAGYHKEFEHAEDIDLWLRLAEKGKLANLPDLGLLYRLHPSSTSARKRKAQILSQHRAIEAARERRGFHPELIKSRIERVVDEGTPKLYQRWGWWALKEGENRTALLYGMKSLARSPLSKSSLGLVLAAARAAVRQRRKKRQMQQ